MEKNNMLIIRIILIVSILFLIVYFFSPRILNMAQFSHKFWVKEGNKIILNPDNPKLISTNGFIATGLNSGGRNYLKKFEEDGLYLKGNCIIEAHIVSTHGIIKPFDYSFNGKAKVSNGNLECYISSDDINNLKELAIKNCDNSWISEHSTKRCVDWSVFSENTRVIWEFAEPECENGAYKCENFNYYECENNVWVEKGIVKGNCGVECISDDDCEEDSLFGDNFCLNETAVGKKLNDYYCSEDYTCKTKIIDKVIKICDYKCSDGKCIEKEGTNEKKEIDIIYYGYLIMPIIIIIALILIIIKLKRIVR